MLGTFIQQVINGLMLGGGYALVAIGYTLIFGVLNLLHLAHGEVAMIGSYIGLTLVLTAMSQVGVLPVWVVLIVAMLGAGIVGIVVELIAFRPLGRKQLHITPLITTIAVAFALQETAVKLFGSEQRSFPVAMFDQLKKYDLQLGAFVCANVHRGRVARPDGGTLFFCREDQDGQGDARLRREHSDRAAAGGECALDHDMDLRHRLCSGGGSRGVDRAGL